jgi:hypothetical protein
MKLLTATGVALFLSGLLAVVWTDSLNPSDFNSNIFNPIILLMILGTVALGFVSLGLARMPIPRFRMKVIAVAFVIIALSVPATFLYAEQTSVVGCLGPCSASPLPSFIVSGTIITQPGSNNATLTVHVLNTNDPGSEITSVALLNQCPNDCPNSNGTIPTLTQLYSCIRVALLARRTPSLLAQPPLAQSSQAT